MKGIVLAGGYGTRLYPLTISISKQLLPVYDKPMIYYPISVLLLSGIREILIISSKEHINLYKNLLKTGSQFGVKFEYKEQDEPRGLADAFILGKDFIGESNVALILGDNIFYGSNFSSVLTNAIKSINQGTGAVVFGYFVKDPKPYGVAVFGENGNLIGIEEKPVKPKSNFIIPGLYFYNNEVVKIAQNIKPSVRGELEITSVNQKYIEKNNITLIRLGRGIAWFDAGTSSSLLEVSNFVEAIQKQQGFYIASLEEIAFLKSYITRKQLIEQAETIINSDYGKYLVELAENTNLEQI